MHEVELMRRPIGALSSLLPPDQAARLGGGVAEMLHNLLGYFLDAGVDARWLVIDADEQFFETTKHLHNAIHGLGDGDFTKKDHKHYEKVMTRNPVQDLLSAGGMVMLHGPQTAGLTGPVRDKGASV